MELEGWRNGVRVGRKEEEGQGRRTVHANEQSDAYEYGMTMWVEGRNLELTVLERQPYNTTICMIIYPRLVFSTTPNNAQRRRTTYRIPTPPHRNQHHQ